MKWKQNLHATFAPVNFRRAKNQSRPSDLRVPHHPSRSASHPCPRLTTVPPPLAHPQRPAPSLSSPTVASRGPSAYPSSAAPPARETRAGDTCAPRYATRTPTSPPQYWCHRRRVARAPASATPVLKAPTPPQPSPRIAAASATVSPIRHPRRIPTGARLPRMMTSSFPSPRVNLLLRSKQCSRGVSVCVQRQSMSLDGKPGRPFQAVLTWCVSRGRGCPWRASLAGRGSRGMRPAVHARLPHGSWCGSNRVQPHDTVAQSGGSRLQASWDQSQQIAGGLGSVTSEGGWSDWSGVHGYGPGSSRS